LSCRGGGRESAGYLDEFQDDGHVPAESSVLIVATSSKAIMTKMPAVGDPTMDELSHWLTVDIERIPAWPDLKPSDIEYLGVQLLGSVADEASQRAFAMRCVHRSDPAPLCGCGACSKPTRDPKLF
jgi:hypothetical protein